jgi:DNA-directed RNA polymerase specialized sigma24 family protein
MESTATVQSENVTITVSSNLSYEEQFLQATGKNFNVYYKKFYNKLVYYIKSMSITQLDAEELAATAFMTSLEKIHQYKPEYQYST